MLWTLNLSPLLKTEELHECLCFLGSQGNAHFTSEDLKSLGYHVCDTLLDFCDPDHSKVRAQLQKSFYY